MPIVFAAREAAASQFPLLYWRRAVFQNDLLKGQRFLVTGGGTGLGCAMAENFLALGADVAICGRRQAVCEETAAQWRTQFPQRRVDTFGLDIRDAHGVEEMVGQLW